MSTILFYSPFNQRSRDTESLMIAFKKYGHRVMSLSQDKGLYIHEYLSSQGIETFSHIVESKNQTLYYLRHLLFFISFCRRQKVDIVYSHLEPANFVSVIGQFFIRSKVIIVRHHTDEGALSGFDKSFFYRITYRLARKIITVSRKSSSYMVERENVDAKKIIHINLAYDFSLYKKPDPDIVKNIRTRFGSKVVLITACRFAKYKRADQSIAVLKKLIKNGFDAALLLLGVGPEQPALTQLVTDEGLTDHVVFTGYVNNILDYFTASDFLLHPSITESSCVVVKEAGLARLPVIVCDDVGDFSEYICHGESGFVVPIQSFVDDSVKIIMENHAEKNKLNRIGNNLHRQIIDNFSVENIIGQYEKLNDFEF